MLHKLIKLPSPSAAVQLIRMERAPIIVVVRLCMQDTLPSSCIAGAWCAGAVGELFLPFVANKSFAVACSVVWFLSIVIPFSAVWC